MDEAFTDEELEGMSGMQAMRDRVMRMTGRNPTVRDFLEVTRRGRPREAIVGSGKDIADRLEKWFVERACDGFVVAGTHIPGTFEDFVRFVVPELQRRGLYHGLHRRDVAGESGPAGAAARRLASASSRGITPPRDRRILRGAAPCAYVIARMPPWLMARTRSCPISSVRLNRKGTPGMRLFKCQSCGQVLYFENTHCESCGHQLGYLPAAMTVSALEPDGDFLAPSPRPPAAPPLRQRRARGLQLAGRSRQRGDPVRGVPSQPYIPDLTVPLNLQRWQRLEAANTICSTRCCD